MSVYKSNLAGWAVLLSVFAHLRRVGLRCGDVGDEESLAHALGNMDPTV